MDSKTIYMVAADYGGMDNYVEAAFINEDDRNEIALAIAEEVEWCNFNLNVAAWMNMGMREGIAVKTAIRQSLNWSRANPAIGTWEVTLYGG